MITRVYEVNTQKIDLARYLVPLVLSLGDPVDEYTNVIWNNYIIRF